MRGTNAFTHSTTGLPVPSRDMLAAGIDIIPDKKNNIGAKREQRGECPTCGAQTHKKGLFGKKTPLTIVGKVRDGQCLVCHPLEGYIRRPDTNGYSQQPHVGGMPPRRLPQNPMPPELVHQIGTIHTDVPQPAQFLRAPTDGMARPRRSHPERHSTAAHAMLQEQFEMIPEEAQYFPETDSGIRVPHTLDVHGMVDDVSVLTMDYVLAQQARNATMGNHGGVAYNSDEETDVQPPAPGRRPGPDSGDSFSREEPQVARLHVTRGNSYRESHMSVGASHRMRPGNHLLPSKEHPPQMVMTPSFEEMPRGGHQPRGGYDFEEQKHEYNGGIQRKGYNADGYPGAPAGQGWDDDLLDMMPPGGPDMLFRNRVGERDMAQSIHSRQSSSYGEGNRFQATPGKPSRTVPRGNPGMSGDPTIPFNRRQLSMESGPMFLQDEIPITIQNGFPKHHRLNVQESEPMHSSGSVHDHRYVNGGDVLPGQRARGMPLQYHATEARSQGFNSRTAASIAVGKRNDDDRMPRNLGNARRGTDASVSSSTSSAGRPLVNRDLRGRPDDDFIHDPIMIMNPAHRNPVMGNLMDEPQGDEDNWPAPVPMTSHSRSDAKFHSIRQSHPVQYAPEISPVGLRRRGVPQNIQSIGDYDEPGEKKVASEYQYPQEEEKVKAPAEYLYLHEEDKRKALSDYQYSHEEAKRKAPGSPSSPTLLDHASSDHGGIARAAPRAPSPDSHNPYALAAAAAPADFSPPRGADKITAQEQKVELSPPRNSAGHPVEYQEQMIDDVPGIIRSLGMAGSDASAKCDLLRRLASILWKSGGKGRSVVMDYNGVDTLTTTIWDDIGDAHVQDAAAEVLLAMAASSDADPKSDLLANQDAICDSLLFAMQTHAHVPSVQLKGCSIFACLAAASANNPNISDGSLSGALIMVLTAMNNHSKSLEIQKSGLQALYNQCTLSRDAESNKRTLVESQIEGGSSGIDVILDTMKSPLQNDLVAMEWACRLCWSLSSSQDLVKMLSGNPVMIGEISDVCHHNLANQEATPLLEACFGVLGNMAHIDSNRIELVRCGAVQALMEGMRYHVGDFSVNIEACTALANLALAPPIRDAIINNNGIEVVLRGFERYFEYDDFVVEAMRVLVCLALESEVAKESMSSQDVIQLVVAASSRHQDSIMVQELSCKLLASLATQEDTSDFIVQHGGLDVVVRALQSYSDERLHDAACFLYRNLACQLQNPDALVKQGAVRHTINAMSSHEGSVSIQTNACCALWNISSKTNKDPGSVVGSAGIQAIVKAMQTHLESSELLEVACGALWFMVDGSIDVKKDVVGSGAIDAVICALVMHQTESTLIKASGVFSNISAEAPLAEAFANAQGVSVVCDAMCNNGAAIAFLEVCCLTLRNIIYHFPEYADEAAITIPTIIEAMRDNMTATTYLKEACKFLWVLAGESDSCRSKILEMDGIAILMQCIEQNGHDNKLQEAARGD